MIQRYIKILFLVLVCTACEESSEHPHQKKNAPEQRVLNVCQWAEYMDPQVIAAFEAETGIKVILDEIDSNEALESRLLASRTGYDVVFPSLAPYFLRQKKLGLLSPLDRNKLTQFKHVDLKLLKLLTDVDPSEEELYGIPYMWGTTGLAYNADKIKEILPDTPLDSWALIFDPHIVSKLAHCGVALHESAVEIFPALQLYLGFDSLEEGAETLAQTGEAFATIRPFIRKFQGLQSLEDLARGDACLAQVWSGDAVRAAQWSKHVKIEYVLPKEGSIVWADMITIPKDAQHMEEAYLFIDFLLRPEIMARNSLFTQYANICSGSKKFLPESFINNPMIYPSPSQMNRLRPDVLHTPEYDIQSTRLLTKIILLNPKKTGKRV